MLCLRSKDPWRCSARGRVPVTGVAFDVAVSPSADEASAAAGAAAECCVTAACCGALQSCSPRPQLPPCECLRPCLGHKCPWLLAPPVKIPLRARVPENKPPVFSQDSEFGKWA